MRFMIATLMAAAGLFSPLSAMAESADVEAVITNVDTASLSLSLDDGEKYQAPDGSWQTRTSAPPQRDSRCPA